ncbi:glutathione S-transferase family protein [Pacificispira sp.]|uniref:glutathione S-transferase family protein n=1 Tax=Pacificispira sp. TaxID=2888761 RepID=UPI003BAD088A
MLTVYGRRSAFNVQKVLWLVGELGLEHRHIEKGGSHGGLDDPEFRRMNPHGKVPVILHDGAAIWESHTILRYLGATFGAPDYWPAKPAERARIEQWMDWGQTVLQPDFLNGVFWNGFRVPEEKQDKAAVRAKIQRCAAHMTLLEREIGDRFFLLGDKLTLADIVIGTHLYRYFEMDIERPSVPGVEAMYARLTARPAYRAAVMLPFEDMRGRVEY